MGLRDIVADRIATADRITADLQPQVTIYRRTGQTGAGKPTYAAPVRVPAIVDWMQKNVRTKTGAEAVSRCYIGFLRPTVLDEADKIVLPDGTTGPILDMSGFVDRATGAPYFVQVWLG
jgi:hypothetical protein